MPLPKEQRTQLQTDLDNHDKELRELRARGHTDQPDVREAIGIHEAILKIGRDPAILKALDELFDTPELAGQLASDPQAFTKVRGIHLPPGTTKIVVLSQAPQPLAIGINARIGQTDFRMEWRAEAGFGIRQLPAGSA